MENFEIQSNKNKEETENSERLLVPLSEISEQFSRSSGKGGQNVNKLSTKVEVRWNVDKSQAFSEAEKEKIKQVLSNRINKEGDLIVTSQEERSQFQNRERAIERLNNLVATALMSKKERILTKPTQASQERRIEKKKKLSEKKKWRQEKVDY